MSLPAEWKPCLELAGALALESSLIIGLAALLTNRMRLAQWQRAVWQVSLLSILAIALSQITGVSGGIAQHIRLPTLWERTTPAPQTGARNLHTQSLDLTAQFRERVAQQLARNQQRAALQPHGQSFDESPLQDRLAADGQDALHQTIPWPELLWLAGIAAALAPGWLARLALFALHRPRGALGDSALQDRIGSLARRMGLRRPVRVFECPRLKGPVVFGVLRSSIALPKGFTTRYGAAQQEVMLAHELAHVAARDPLWQALAGLTAALLWWNPLLWWARHQLRLSAESAADEASLLVSDGPGVLAECLLALASDLTTRPAPGWLGITGFRSNLGRRVKKLLELKGDTWSPPRRTRMVALKVLVTIALVVATAFGTAAITPQPVLKGETMKTAALYWKRSLATVALLAAFGAEHGDSQVNNGAIAAQDQGKPAAQTAEILPEGAQPAKSGTQIRDVATLIADARLLENMGKLDEAEAKLQDALKIAPDNKKAARELSNIKQRRLGRLSQTFQEYYAQKRDDLSAREGQNANADAARETPQDNGVRRWLAARYGFRAQTAPAAAAPPDQRKKEVEAKLNQIVLLDDLYDGLPLSEVVRDLNEQALKRDPEKQGINFLISNVVDQPGPTGIDPTTGQPLPGPSVIEIGSVPIKLHLRNVSLKDILDAITKVAPAPIKYSVEDYGVLLSPGPGSYERLAAGSSRQATTPRLQVRIFHVETNTFLAGLQSAFGIKVGHTANAAAQSPGVVIAQVKLGKAEHDLQRAAQLAAQAAVSQEEVEKARDEVKLAQAELEAARAQVQRATPVSTPDIQKALRQLLQQLGIDMEVPNKAVFYNDITGIVMVRATPDDLDLVQAAIETLGGRLLRSGMVSEVEHPNAPAESSSATVVGKVIKEGVIDFPSGGRMDVLEGIARAGGLAPTANRNKIQLSRGPASTTYRYEDLIKKRVWLEPGDVINVPETFF